MARKILDGMTGRIGMTLMPQAYPSTWTRPTPMDSCRARMTMMTAMTCRRCFRELMTRMDLFGCARIATIRTSGACMASGSVRSVDAAGSMMLMEAVTLHQMDPGPMCRAVNATQATNLVVLMATARRIRSLTFQVTMMVKLVKGGIESKPSQRRWRMIPSLNPKVWDLWVEDRGRPLEIPLRHHKIEPNHAIKLHKVPKYLLLLTLHDLLNYLDKHLSGTLRRSHRGDLQTSGETTCCRTCRRPWPATRMQTGTTRRDPSLGWSTAVGHHRQHRLGPIAVTTSELSRSGNASFKYGESK